MKWLGIDLEVNRRNDGQGIWNMGIALFKGRKTLDYYNIFIEEFFSEDVSDGYGSKYFKSRKRLSKARRPVWVKTAEDADHLAATIIEGWKFSRSFGYNSSAFDLGKMQGVLPKTLALVLAKPHLDLMPLAVAHLVGRESYKKFWETNVAAGNTHEGHPEYAKFSAELVLNYLLHIRKAGSGKWKKEDHIGVEDLVDFEYPILHYFTRILKKGIPDNVDTQFLKWEV